MALSANISSDIDFGKVPFNVNFRVENLYYDSEISGFLWQFGDGQTSTQQNPQHVYSTYGLHTVVLTVFGISGETHVEIEPDLIKGLKLDFRAEIIPKSDRYTVLFVNEASIPPGYTVLGWEWDFGDGSVISEESSPTHDYVLRGNFNVVQSVTVLSPDDVETTFTCRKSNLISRDPVFYNTCNKFLCMGWVKKPTFSPTEEPLYPFAISDPDYQVIGSNDALKFAIEKEGSDYRLSFMGAKTKLINKTIKVNLGDDAWHSLVYTCYTDDGHMRFLVDGVDVPFEQGFNTDGYTFDIAHGETSRPGGGNVWAPYLYEAGQGIMLFNWRFKAGLNISDTWLAMLLEEDKQYLGTNNG